MPENNQYSDREGSTFTPVAVVLVVAIAVVLGIFVYARSQNEVGPAGAPVPGRGGPVPVNPAEPVVPGTGIPANPNSPG